MSTATRTKLDSAALTAAADCLRTVAHPHRLRMLQLMLDGEHSVGELAEACDIASHQASEHLMLMKRCGLLRSESKGRRVYYRVSEPQIERLMACIELRYAPEK